MHKKGETIPNISYQEALILHHNICDKPHIIKKPLENIEQTTMFSKKFFYTFSWQCLNCKWESDVMKTRII